MLRSLHMKLVLIMVLLVVCLMTIVGAFLINSVNRFYLDAFYAQMTDVFSEDDKILRELTVQTEEELQPVQGTAGPESGEETDLARGAKALQKVLFSKMGALGVDGRNRNFYILDGDSGRFLQGSSEDGGQSLEMTPQFTPCHQ